jgi:four helix bundle protein
MNNVSMSMRKRMKQFAVQIFELIDKFPTNRKGGIIQSQLARSASSAAANYRAAQRCRSRAEFISKLNTVFEEIDESAFWLEFSVDTKTVRPEAVADLSKEADELAAIVCASRATARKNGTQFPRQ